MQHQAHELDALATRAPLRWRDLVAAGLLSLLLLALAACGGGTETAGVGTGGTGAFSVGPISGLGSIVVNGVHYDDSAASVVDDDGNPSARDALQVGMVVEVRGSVGDDGTTGAATAIAYSAEVKGPVTAVDASAGTLRVFDRLVQVTPSTVYAGAGGLAGIAVGSVVEVYGLPDAGGALTATRIELEAASVDAFDGEFRVRGEVGALSGTAPSQRLTVAGVTLTTDAATRVDGTLVVGGQVSARLSKTVANDGSYAATRIRTLTRSYDDDTEHAEVEGLVAGFTTPSAPFTVNGYPVRLDGAVVYEGGVAADLGNGVRVEVEGDISGGVLIARKLEFKHADADGGEDGSDAPFEFKGVASCSPAPCSSPAGSFVVRGVTVQYDAETRFDDGLGAASLDGATVEVKAVAVAGTGGSGYRATRIEPAN